MSVNMSKDQKVRMTKSNGTSKVGLGWDPAKGGGRVDLDASALEIDLQGRVIDEIWFRHLRSNDGAIVHTGDNLTGAGEGDDETITVQLSAVPADVMAIYFTVNAFNWPLTFAKVRNATCRFVDSEGREVARFNLGDLGKNTGLIIGRLVRSGTEWDAQAIGEITGGRTVGKMVEPVEKHYAMNPAA